ncbi:hypothetical protein [Bacteriovorax sp. Seq25_V]|uniref:hypothetical protein n=1 Tax=Bacteriovorax sp. Seq25_V TaxID=1201288 RepID=UPI000555F910|nr:hypothetical protein [Bacteriovorax sp. Seq25_V]
MKKLIFSLILFTNFTFALEATDCLQMSQDKIIDISNETVFNVNRDCKSEDRAIEVQNLAFKLYPYGEITNLETRESTIDEAISVLKDTDSTYKETEDLIKLMDFFPSALPAQLKISEFTYQENGETSQISIIIIDSENILVNSEKTHKIITVSTK